MDPDPAQQAPPTLHPDSYQHLPLSPHHTLTVDTGPHRSQYGDRLIELFATLQTIHFSSYLCTLHSALNRSTPVPRNDFLAGLKICQKSAFPVDFTPLVAALCEHSTVKLQPSTVPPQEPRLAIEESSPLSPQMLCHLLKTISLRIPSSCQLFSCDEEEEEEEEEELKGPTPHCQRWKAEIEQAFLGYLTEMGFAGVPGCDGYYWLSTTTSQQHPQRSRMKPRRKVPYDRIPHLEEVQEEDSAIEEELPSSLTSPFPPSSPLSELTVRDKFSFSMDDDASQMTEVATNKSGSSSDEEMIILPLFSPTGGEGAHRGGGGDCGNGEGGGEDALPLFLHVVCRVRHREAQIGGNEEGEEEEEEKGETLEKAGPPLCLKSLLSECTNLPRGSDGSYSVSLDLLFLSFSPKGPELEERTKEESQLTIPESPLPLPPPYHETALTLRHRVEWLIEDELISVSREVSRITPPLLQAVAAHVQASHHAPSCFARPVPLKFVFGPDRSMLHFITHLEAINVPTCSITKLDDYYYLVPKVHSPSPTYTREPSPVPDLEPALESPIAIMSTPRPPSHFRRRPSLSPSDECSMTPSPVNPFQHARKLGHRRSTSAGGPPIYGGVLTPEAEPNDSRFASYGSIASLKEEAKEGGEEEGSGYEASRSCSMSSLSGFIAGLDREKQGDEGGGAFWLVLRVLPHEVEIYFQLRSSQLGSATLQPRFSSLCDRVRKEVEETCHRTNQWFLLRDMLETRKCSLYLLAESPSEAWVEEVVLQKQSGIGHAPFEFRPQAFHCDVQWSKHITPHWRVKAMKAQASLKITRSALNAFAVNNRADLYVLQDVKDTGEETIFYLKIDESMCRVDDNSSGGLEESIRTSDGRDTHATGEVESLSSFSLRQSISELRHDVPELERQLTGSSMELNVAPLQFGRSQESLVLQLYGITKPSIYLIDRLIYMIQQKLDHATLEILCGLYARNRRLHLTPADVLFLQPHHSETSHVLSIVVPQWVRQVDAFALYYLQALSAMTLKPRYSSKSDSREHFQVPLELQNKYLTNNLPKEMQQDHIFLYIRPHIQGRGMAVICACLTGPKGQLLPPRVRVIAPDVNCWDPGSSSLEEATECTVLETTSHARADTGSYSIRLYVWEKGNVGLADLSHKFASCFKYAICDYLLELCLLPQPIAQLGDTPDDFISPRSAGSPFVIIDTPVPSPWKSPGPRRAVSSDGGTGMRRPELSSKRRIFETVAERAMAGGKDEGTSGRGTPLSASVPSDVPIRRSRTDTDGIMDYLDSALRSINAQTTESEDGGSSESPEFLSWNQKEKIRREQEAREVAAHEAHCGHTGILEPAYQLWIQQHLEFASSLNSPSVSHHIFTLVGSYSAHVFLSQLMADIHQICPDIAMNAFKAVRNRLEGTSQRAIPQYLHHLPERDLTKSQKTEPEITDVHYIVIGRNIPQWEESCNPGVLETRITQAWVDAQSGQLLQMFHPLDSKKLSRLVEVPFQQLVNAGKAVFIPRQRVIVVSITNDQAQLWLYNLSDELSNRLKRKLRAQEEWLQMRAGFLHNVLAQKMGLFQHTHGQDLEKSTKPVAMHLGSIQEISTLVKSVVPTPIETTPTRSGQRHSMTSAVALDMFYLETLPHSLSHSTADPIFNHGQQFRELFGYQKRQFEVKELLGKVFKSWQRKKGGESSADAPVSSSTITSLKKTARLLHHCTSPLLLARSLSTASRSPETETQGSALWLDAVKERLLALYIEYLRSLGFQPVNERASSVQTRQRGSRTPSHTPTRIPTPTHRPDHPQKLYKCLQRSWPGGIILIELLLREELFYVKLYSLESSRLETSRLNLPAVNAEIHGLFSTECARYKDFIHVHSFMHDFHLGYVLGILDKTRPTLENFDLRKFLDVFMKQNKELPSFIRNRLCKESLQVAVSVNPSDLYHHVVAHCGVFGMQTFEAHATPTSLGSEDICLLINVCPQSLGPTTTPELSKLLRDSEEKYSIRVIAMFKPLPYEDRGPRYLKLVFFLLLVNKFDSYPRLTCDSPHLSASRHSEPPTSPNDGPMQDYNESELNFNVRKHRRKLGFGSLTSPSAASRMVVDMSVIEDQMRSLKVHLEGVVKSAQHHLRRDELWKRMVYGRQVRVDARLAGASPFEPLAYTEFRELLQLVTVCPLEKLDPRLAPLKKQTKKWYRRLLEPLSVRFADTVRVYQSDDEGYKFAAVINPDWQDMFILLQSDRDARHQGFSAVYRKPNEGGVPREERRITAHVEADQQHIETVVNFACSFLWASILDSAPPSPHINLL